MSTVIRIKAEPGAKKEKITEITPGRLAISVREPADNNRANDRILEIVADFYGVLPKQVRITRGHRTPNKWITVFND